MHTMNKRRIPRKARVDRHRGSTAELPKTGKYWNAGMPEPKAVRDQRAKEKAAMKTGKTLRLGLTADPDDLKNHIYVGFIEPLTRELRTTVVDFTNAQITDQADKLIVTKALRDCPFLNADTREGKEPVDLSGQPEPVQAEFGRVKVAIDTALKCYIWYWLASDACNLLSTLHSKRPEITFGETIDILTKSC